MDLHGIVSGVIDAVNPRIFLFISKSTGYVTNSDGTRTPSYDPPREVLGQVQAETFRDIQQMEGLNLQGTRRVIYLRGHFDGLVRSKNKGGDIITFPDQSVWLIALVLEHWPDWCKVAVTLQDGA
jgi:hypothetical protein